MRLSVTCLGKFQVTFDDQPVTFATNPARALLTYLALETDAEGLRFATRAHHRETLAGLLWSEYLESAARLNLSQTLVRLRRAIHDHQTTPPFLQINRQTIQLDATTVAVDVWRFQQLMTTCASHPHAQLVACPTCCAHLAEAATLYHGPLLAGERWTDSQPFEEWLMFKREQLQRQALYMLHTLALRAEAEQDYAQVQQHAERQLRLEPWRETAHRQLMRALVLSGQRSAALAQYALCRQRLATELDVEPSAETVTLFEQIRRGDFDTPPRPESSNGAPATGQPSTGPSSIGQSSIGQSSTGQPSTVPDLVSAQPDPYAVLSRLEALPDQKLFGVTQIRARVAAVLEAGNRPWLVSLSGIGGIGKTTLANALVHEFAGRARFADIAWISARQAEFSPATGLRATAHPVLDEGRLTNDLLAQLADTRHLTASNREKRATLMHLLKAKAHLVVVDNLETMEDYEALLPYLRQLANPSKFLLTSRHSLHTHSDIFDYYLTELGQADALALLRHDAQHAGHAPLRSATDAQLQSIYAVVGGNPLALKLILGQVRFLPLPQVLENLQQAQGKESHELYTFIYWQAWQMLDNVSRQLFLMLPLEPDCTFSQLVEVANLPTAHFQQALGQLVALSLVDVAGTIEQPRYRLHRLTETFLMTEVLKWQIP